MNAEKFKTWMLKIDSLKIEKPADIAKLNTLTSQAQELQDTAKKLLQSSSHSLQNIENAVGQKMAGLSKMQTKNKQVMSMLKKCMESQREALSLTGKHNAKHNQDLHFTIGRKCRTIQTEIETKNKSYLDSLKLQLEQLKSINSKVDSTGQSRNQNYLSWIQASSKKADRIISQQQKDLRLIEQYQQELVSRCQQVHTQYLEQLEKRRNSSSYKQQQLFRKIQMLLSDIQTQ